MDRKLDAGRRSSRSIARYNRPRLVVAPRTYMDVMAPATFSPSQPVAKPAQLKAKPEVQSRPQPSSGKHFDVKQVTPLKPSHHEAPSPEPVTKEPPVIAAPEVAKPMVSSPDASEVAVKKRTRPVSSKKKRKLFGKSPKQRVLYSMATLLFVAGMYVAIDGWLANRAVVTQANVLSAQAGDERDSGDDDQLREDPPADVKGYRVAPDLPRVISIPSLSVSARVLHLGVKEDNSLAAPSNIHDAGWYTASARPTDKGGAILIDGHVSGPTKPGVFYGLKKLRGGEEVILERGDGQKLTFIVKQVETVQADQVDMLKLLNPIEPGKLGLNLITCGGEFNASDNSFKSRVLVFAILK